MGLKSKLSKMKNFLFDEEEVEKPEKKKEKEKPKKVIKEKVEIEKVPEKAPEIDDFYFNDISDIPDDSVAVKSRVTKETSFEFPEYNDNDFMPAQVTSVTEEETVRVEKKNEKGTILYQGSKRREETKRFKPSPIISPIYGLLDESGNEVKKGSSKDDATSYDKTSDFDEVRNRAYGKVLDEELENTISRLNKKTIGEAEKELKSQEEAVFNKKSKEDDEDDDMILPDVSFKEIDVDKVTKKEIKKDNNDKTTYDDDDEDTKEQDLFKLIDKIYSKEGDEKDD